MKEIYEMKGAGRSIRGIADDLGIVRNMVRYRLRRAIGDQAPMPCRADTCRVYASYGK